MPCAKTVSALFQAGSLAPATGCKQSLATLDVTCLLPAIAVNQGEQERHHHLANALSNGGPRLVVTLPAWAAVNRGTDEHLKHESYPAAEAREYSSFIAENFPESSTPTTALSLRQMAEKLHPASSVSDGVNTLRPPLKKQDTDKDLDDYFVGNPDELSDSLGTGDMKDSLEYC